MSMNYYARILPTKERINDLHKAIELSLKGENWNSIHSLIKQTYGTPQSPGDYGTQIHLGNRAAGWKFLWNCNIREKVVGWSKEGIPSEYRHEYIYPLTHEGITHFVMREDVIIVNEYEEVQDKKGFLDMAFSWDGIDGEEYYDMNPRIKAHFNDTDIISRAGYKPRYCDFINDGLLFSTSLKFD